MSWRLILNPIDCDAHGLCAELLPEVISLDDWGYPVIDRRSLPVNLLRPARRAAAACPRLALTVCKERQ